MFSIVVLEYVLVFQNIHGFIVRSKNEPGNISFLQTIISVKIIRINKTLYTFYKQSTSMRSNLQNVFVKQCYR